MISYEFIKAPMIQDIHKESTNSYEFLKEAMMSVASLKGSMISHDLLEDPMIPLRNLRFPEGIYDFLENRRFP